MPAKFHLTDYDTLGPSAAGAPNLASGEGNLVTGQDDNHRTESRAFGRAITAALQNPFVTVNFAILMALAVLAVVYSGKGFLGTFASGEPIAIGMVLAAQLVILGCSVAAATLSTKAKISALAEIATNDSKKLGLLARQNQLLREGVFEIGEQLRARMTDGVVLLRDTPEFWRSVTRGGRVIAIQPGSRTEVKETKGSDGEVRYVIARQGVLTTIKRFGPKTGVASADIVFVQPKAKIRQQAACPEMLRFLALYETAERVARRSGIPHGLDFSSLQIHIVAREEVETTSNFIVDAKLAGQEDRQFLVRYQSATDPLAPVFGRTIEVVTEQSEIDAALINADRMIRSSMRRMTLSEFRKRHIGKLPAFDADDTPMTDDEKSEIGLPLSSDDEVSETIDFGDGSFRV